MDLNKHVAEVVDLFSRESINVLELLKVNTSNEITDAMKTGFKGVEAGLLSKIVEYMKSLLFNFYGIDNDPLIHEAINKYSDVEKHLIKESLIYYIGRLAKTNINDILEQIYFKEIDTKTKLNIACSAASANIDNIELDFINSLVPGSEADLFLRSWTMVFFKDVIFDDPYTYVDNNGDSFENAKAARINRLKINDATHEKYDKAMKFRLLDLKVLYLFFENRGWNLMKEEEYKAIKNCNTDYIGYSREKKQLILDIKSEILSKRG